ncbi:Exodeoxyribonuclease III [hydrothermal vent metagenome]|uniref:Exodeoxyribonuclease III n=1 Tax=hydrothermal vent metagenome TaxID=652676 RepID=A0A3B0R6B7_9ZZZZ
MTIKIASWNVNSVRLRLPQVERFLQDQQPDVLALQEIKCLAEQFPAKAFAKAGYPHQDIVGQKGMHGVAIVSKSPLTAQASTRICPRQEARAQIVQVAGIELVNLYIPAGGDEPDINSNPKFAHKLEFLQNMTNHFAKRSDQNTSKTVLVGDLNIAPGEFDVWSHKQMKNVVSHTKIEIKALQAMQASFGFIDMARVCLPEPEKLFTWWSYRSKDWTKNNRGRRLDHIWVSKTLAGQDQAEFIAHTDCRSWERPSDHAPITLKMG